MKANLTSRARASFRASSEAAWWAGLSARWLAAAALCAFGAVLLLAPVAVAQRASFSLAHYGLELASTVRVLRAVGASSCSLGFVAAAFPHLGPRAQMLAAVSAYLPLAFVFTDWHVDDAAITYAYVENLVRGHGLVLHPAHAPEEGYSNLLWLLLLAAPRAFGVGVASTAKVLATLVGAGTVALCVACVQRCSGRALRGPAFAVVIATLSTSPFVIWSISGLEHGLQAAILLGLVWCATGREGAPWTMAALASALVLTRPEAPLVVAALALALVVDTWRTLSDEQSKRALAHASEMMTLAAHGPSVVQRARVVVASQWPIAVLPLATFAALTAFRLLYFGDPLPNPYYAKASEATFARLGNPFGTGWSYVAGWLVQGSGFLLVAPLCLLAQARLPRGLKVALAVLAGQLIFVIYAGGDWMAQWRFLAAPIAVLAFIVGYAVQTLTPVRPLIASRYAALVATAMIFTDVPLLASFRAQPTTPYTEVAEIGHEFLAISRRLGIANPRLAHHDIGGTSYLARIDVLDLGGLGRRAIAKLVTQPQMLRQYLLEQERPDFIFGSTTTCAAYWSRFHESERFKRDYVRLQVSHPSLAHADLCHVRRDRVREAPGVLIEREGGKIARVHVLRGAPTTP